MGSGTWSSTSYTTHSTTTRGFASMDDFATASTQELYRSRRLADELNPYKVTRECADSKEHPFTKPVILALDVTGSMGEAANAVATKLNEIMENIYENLTDVEFCVMAVGDLSYDRAPLQVSQFESDIRIAEQLEKVYFEGGGGGNKWESYTLPWYFGLYHTKLDCWDRGQKGVIITLGDEPLNPYLPKNKINAVLGDSLQADVETNELYKKVNEKFEIYHICVDENASSYKWYKSDINKTWGHLLKDKVKVSDCQNLPKTISNILNEVFGSNQEVTVTENKKQLDDDGFLTW